MREAGRAQSGASAVSASIAKSLLMSTQPLSTLSNLSTSVSTAATGGIAYTTRPATHTSTVPGQQHGTGMNFLYPIMPTASSKLMRSALQHQT